MSIETVCPGCGRTLRVASEHAGKQARCPQCNTIYTVAEGSSDELSDEAEAAEAAEWRMRVPEGQTYGPITKTQLDGWVAEGRVTADCAVHCESDGQWQAADAVYAVLRPNTAAAVESQPQSQSTGSTTASRTRYRYTEPHRGVLILALGIFSWVGCPIFGIVAWVLGSTDLREMRAGRMDPSGMGLTQAGQILGMIHAIILIGVLVVVAFVLLASVAAG